MAVGSILLVLVTTTLDQRMPDGWLDNWSWAYTGSAEGASTVLGTIAGSMMTIAGVVFSMTLVALTLASSQFGPRLLRNFMRDTSNQVVIGTFVATFLFSLLVLRTIRHVEEKTFVPHLSVTVAVLLALVSMGVLIYFIHHVSISIQADEIVSRAGLELMEGIDRLFPDSTDPGKNRSYTDGDNLSAVADAFDPGAYPIAAAKDGYIQYIDTEALLRLANREDLVLRLVLRTGHYLSSGVPWILISPANRITEEFETSINEAVILGNQRTPAQDIEMALEQLVEIAVRALSPGVNDPFTAIRCIDRLGSALCRLSGRIPPPPFYRDENHLIRLITRPVTFPGMVDTAFNQIRQNSGSNAAVTIRLLETIALIGLSTPRPEDRAALLRQAEIIARGARENLPDVSDCEDMEKRFQSVRQILGGPYGSES